jgi:hypothetical protein
MAGQAPVAFHHEGTKGAKGTLPFFVPFVLFVPSW